MEKLSPSLIGTLNVSPQFNGGSMHTQAYSYHKLNLNPEKYASSDRSFSLQDMAYWETDSWDLQNGVAEHMPEGIPSLEFRRENTGTLFIAHFPINDFKTVLSKQRNEVASMHKKYYTERLQGIIKSLRNRFRSTQEVSMLLTPRGIHFPGLLNPIDTKWELGYLQEQVKGLKRRMKTAQNVRADAVLILKGYNLSECLEGDGSELDAIILGPHKLTGKLLDGLRASPEFTLTDYFNPNSPNISYEFGALDDRYNVPPFTTGEYNPLINLRELKVRDYRELA